MRSNSGWMLLMVAMALLSSAGCGGKSKDTVSQKGTQDQSDKRPGSGNPQDDQDTRASSGETTVGKSSSRSDGDRAIGGQNGKTPDTNATATTASPPDYSFVTSDHFAAMVFHPRRVMQNRMVPDIPNDLIKKLHERTAVQPDDVQEVVVLLDKWMIPESPEAGPPPDTPTILVRFVNPIDVQSIAPKMLEDNVVARVVGEREYLLPESLADVQDTREVPVLFQWSNKELIFAQENSLRAIFLNQQQNPLREKLEQLSDDFNLLLFLPPIQPRLLKLSEAGKKQIPEPYWKYLEIPRLLKSVTARANLGAVNLLNIEFQGYDAEAAQQIDELVQSGLQLGRFFFSTFRGQLASSLPEEISGPMLLLADEMVAGISVSTSSDTVALSLEAPDDLERTVSDVGPKLVQMAQQAQHTRAELNRLKMVALAFHNYHDAYGEFPRNIRAEDGTPLLSWRVSLLPFLDESGLFEQIDRKQAWNSEVNRRVLAQMPAVFGSQPDGKTSIVRLQGANTLVDDDRRVTLSDVRDGLSNTLLYIEAGPDKGVPWTEPVDLDFDSQQGTACLGQLPEKGFRVAFVDGSVVVLPSSISADQLSGLVDPRDGRGDRPEF